MTGEVSDATKPVRGLPFLQNVFWSWLGVLFSIVSGIFLSPYVIRHLGSEAYGVWAVVFSLVDYYALVDFGFRSAILKYAAHYRATNAPERLEVLLSTGLVYFSMAAVVVLGVSLVISRYIEYIFKVSPSHLGAMRFLVITVGVGFAMGVVFSACTAVLEAYQRFDITSRIQIVGTGIRVTTCFGLLFIGLGLKTMGICVLSGQVIAYTLTWRAMRRLLPGQRLSLRKASLDELRQMLSYGIRSFSANISLNLLSQAPPLMVGHFISATAAGYYIYPRRLLSLSVDMVDRLGMITGSKAAELTALGEVGSLARMTVLVNRYCLTLFLPLAAYLTVFGYQLLHVWISPGFADNSAPFLPVLGIGVTIAVAASHNSSSVLYGLAKHGAFAKSLMVEAVLCISGLWYVVPRHGALAGACIVSALMIASRGIYVPYVVCRCLKMNYFAYVRGVYGRPLLTMLPVAATAWILNRWAGAPASWAVVLGGGAAMLACYYGLTLLSLEPAHRQSVLNTISKLRARSSGSSGTDDVL